jgi:hypothetical protein
MMASNYQNRGMRKCASWCTAAFLACAFAGQSVSAVVLKFNLMSHPYGGITDPLYGFRLDGIDGDPGHQFTFDFNRAEANPGMMLILDNGDDDGDGTIDAGRTQTVSIMGQAWGGQDIGQTYATNAYLGLWDIEFNYTGNVLIEFDQVFLGSIEVTVNPEDQVNNTGKIEKVGNSALKYVLQDEDGGTKGFSFKFNNVDNHRLGIPPATEPGAKFVGWGWVNHALAPDPGGEFQHLAASDWLFVGMKKDPPGQTFPEVPEPVTGVLGLMGLGVLSMATRRRMA